MSVDPSQGLPQDVHTVELAVPDAYGTLRGKRVPASAWPAVLASGIHMCSVIYSWTPGLRHDRHRRHGIAIAAKAVALTGAGLPAPEVTVVDPLGATAPPPSGNSRPWSAAASGASSSARPDSSSKPSRPNQQTPAFQPRKA